MTPEQARQHAEHLCDVWADVDDDDIHVGVIEHIATNGTATVAGHPSYGTRTLPIADLSTACRIGQLSPEPALVSEEQAEYDDYWRATR